MNTQPLTVIQGETIDLCPQFLSYGAALSLSNATRIVMIYTNRLAGYAIDGTASTNGIAIVRWTSTNATTIGVYSYTIAALSNQTSILRCSGALTVRPGNGIPPTNAPPLWVTAGDVIGLQSGTGRWDKASTDAIAATNVIPRVAMLEAGTGRWDKASTDAIAATSAIPRVAMLEAGTGRWDRASTDAITATSAIPRVAMLEAGTGRWDTAAAQAANALNSNSYAPALGMSVTVGIGSVTTNADTNTLVVSAAADPGANQFYCWDGNASYYTGLTNSDYWIAYTGLWQAFYQGNNFASRPPGQPVTGTWEFAQLTAEYGSTYTTNYTYTTNLASVVAGKALGSISNASINGIMGTVSGGISRLTVALPSVPVADGFSILDRSGVWSVADWLQNGFLAERYYVWRIDDGDGLGLVDGAGYWFDDQNGLLAAQSTNQVWANPGYKNSLLTDGWAFHSQQSAGKMTSASISMPSGDTSWTVSVWLYMQAVRGWAPWIWFGDGNGTRDPAGSFMVRGWASDDFVLGHDNGGGDAPYWQLYDASTWQATTGQWVHCVFQYDASTSFEYFWTNGYLRASNALSFDMTWSGSGVFYLSSNPFGETPPDNFWDDCAFFSRCITPSEVATLYGGGSGFSPGTTNVAPFNDGLLAYWPMNEGAGTSTEDIGPQGADGTFSGGTAYWVASPYGASSIFSSNMTVACTNRLLNFVPSNARVSALIDSTGGVPTTNIVKVLASRDLGTTWTAAVISQIETWSVSNYLYVGMCSLTNQPSGSNVTVKVVVTNSPLTVRVYGVAAPCAP